MHINHIPPELRYRIFRDIYLDEIPLISCKPSPTLLRCSMVCKAWLGQSRWLAFSHIQAKVALPAEAQFYTHILPWNGPMITGGTFAPYIQDAYLAGPHLGIIRSCPSHSGTNYREFSDVIHDAACVLTGLQRLSFSQVDFTQLRPKTIDVLDGPFVHNITKLMLMDVTFQDIFTLGDFISRFHSLRQLGLEGVHFKHRLSKLDTTPSVPQSLDTLSVQLTPDLASWFLQSLDHSWYLEDLKVTNVNTENEFELVSHMITRSASRLRSLCMDIPYLAKLAPDFQEDLIPMLHLENNVSLTSLAIRGLPSTPRIAPTIDALAKMLQNLSSPIELLTLGFIIDQTSENQYRTEKDEWGKLDSVLLHMNRTGLTSINITLLVRQYRLMPRGVYGPFVPLLRDLLPGIEKEGLLKVEASNFRYQKVLTC